MNKARFTVIIGGLIAALAALIGGMEFTTFFGQMSSADLEADVDTASFPIIFVSVIVLAISAGAVGMNLRTARILEPRRVSADAFWQRHRAWLRPLSLLLILIGAGLSAYGLYGFFSEFIRPLEEGLGTIDAPSNAPSVEGELGFHGMPYAMAGMLTLSFGAFVWKSTGMADESS